MTDAETAADCASVAGLDHLEVTARSGAATSGSSTIFTIKACADASCSTLFTNGVTGTPSTTTSPPTTTACSTPDTP